MEHNYICNLIFCLPALYFGSTWSRSIIVINAFYLHRGILHNEGDGVISVQMTNLFIYWFLYLLNALSAAYNVGMLTEKLIENEE